MADFAKVVMSPRNNDFAEQAVLSQLGFGRNNAASLSAIAERLGWSRRAVEAAIQALRADGKAVASGSEGIWLADNPADMEVTFAQLRRRIVSQSMTAWAVRATARRMRAAGIEQLTWTEAA